MERDASSPIQTEHPSPQRRPWETPLLQAIRVDEQTEHKGSANPTEPTPAFYYGPS